MSEGVKIGIDTARRMAAATARVEAMEPAGRGRPGVGKPRDTQPVEFWAEVTGPDPSDASRSAWRMVIPDATGGVIVPSPAITGAGLYEVNDGTLSTGQRVRARLVGKDANGAVYVCAAGGLPLGTGQYKVLQLVDVANPGKPGWDYIRLVDL